MNHLFFRVAEAYFDVEYKGADDVRLLMPSYAPFNVSKSEADGHQMFTIKVNGDPVPFQGEGEELGQFDCGGINHGIYQLPEGGYLILISNVQGEPACAMRTSAEFRYCQATLYGEEPANRSFGLGNALMIAFAFSGAYHQIILMHSSVTMKDGGGHLFLGKSGTGKSTHSTQWLTYLPDTELLNDDNPALRFHPEDGTAWVYGTPWSGKTPCYKNKQVPARAIVRLEQFPENIIQREPALKGFASILSSCSTMIWDKPSYRQICDTISEIAKRVPVFYLKCRPDEEAARVCHAAIAKVYE